MAGGQERILKRRISSVRSTKKITRAMELIAGSRIVKAQAAVKGAHPYSELISKVVADLAAGGGSINSPILKPRERVKRSAHIVIAADRGLCGAYNSSVVRAAEGSILEDEEIGAEYALILVGRKAEGYFRYRDFRIDNAFTGFSDQPSYEDARAIGQLVSERFINEEYDKVELIYTRFISAGKQEVVRRPLLPLERDVISGGDGKPGDESSNSATASYEFESSPEALLSQILPKYIEARIFAALLNAGASEHAARQRAMKAATDNAEELIKELSRVMNRARQDAITTEIMEIVGGAEALSSSDSGADEDSAARAIAFERDYLEHQGAGPDN
ncbi:MAG: F0F1 ATP synthase subunit gamma [Acidimicrobiia bacterium]|nr:F0F1 ATP synthase subunit gamma [Acidimicrobiia bacterium]